MTEPDAPFRHPIQRAEEELLASLNEQQKEAVLYGDGPLLIFAGAGSGKTRVLTHRAAHLVRCRNVPSYNILCVTFTNKAANEMKERLAQLLGRLRWDMWVGTFHSICSRLLRNYADTLRIKRDFTIYDESEQLVLIKDCIKDLGYNPEMLQPSRVLNRISAAKNELIDPRRFEQTVGDLFERQTAEVYKLYQQKLLLNEAFDYDDLIMRCVQMLEEHPQIREELQERFRYLLVDEYQDINFAQYRWVSLLAEKYRNLCVVGDDDQSIYGWRGADMRIILKFDKDFADAKVVKLEQNYRSTANILSAAWEVIRHNRTRREKKLWTEAEEGPPIHCMTCSDEHQEAVYVVSCIERMKETEGRKLSEFAILYRVNAQSRVFEKVFMSYGMPYRIVGGLRFYERAEIKDILAYLRVLVNPADSVSLRRIMNVPPRGIGDKTVACLEAHAALNQTTLLEAVLHPQGVEGLNARALNALEPFGRLYKLLSEKLAGSTLTDITRAIIDESGYRTHLLKEGTIQARTRLENVEELLTATQEFEASSEEAATVSAFLENVALITAIDTLEAGVDAVPLMTLHSAKGLEFPVVFMVGLEEGLFPLVRAAFAVDPLELEEERRLCYVGMTRAKQQLYMSWARMRTIFGYTSPNKASRFLECIPEELMQSAGQEAGHYETWEGASAQAGQFLRADADSSLYSAGDRVRHGKFGEGVVISAELDGDGQQIRVTVAFPRAGVKKLSLEHAVLEKV